MNKYNPNRTDNLKFKHIGYGGLKIAPFKIGRIYNDEYDGSAYDFNMSIESIKKAKSQLMCMLKNISLRKRLLKCLKKY